MAYLSDSAGRRSALPRRSAMTKTPRASEAGARLPAPSMANFFGHVIEEEEDDRSDWFTNIDEHVQLTNGGFEDVQVLFTAGKGTLAKWCKTDMKGILRLVKVKEF